MYVLHLHWLQIHYVFHMLRVVVMCLCSFVCGECSHVVSFIHVKFKKMYMYITIDPPITEPTKHYVMHCSKYKLAQRLIATYIRNDKVRYGKH